ncbi:MAG: alanyl-tRNA editing protein AlaXM [Methanotrichaceae archaeon]
MSKLIQLFFGDVTNRSGDLMDALYLEDSYLQSFEATVEQISDGKYVILDRTAFYPNSGGQPYDLGVLTRDGKEFPVVYVGIFGSKISHEIEKDGVKVGDSVIGTIDWNRRYRFMRSHTACHLLSAMIFRETGAKITGNQIGEKRSRVDFSLKDFDRAKLAEYVDKVNQVIEEDRHVKTRILPREEALKIPDLVRLAKEVPDRDEIRIVEIEGIDVQACGGTHVKRTGEIGRIEMLKAQNKGKANRRVYFGLVGGE